MLSIHDTSSEYLDLKKKKKKFFFKFIFTSLSSSCPASIDFPDSLLPFVPLIHRSWQVLQTMSCVSTELL